MRICALPVGPEHMQYSTAGRHRAINMRKIWFAYGRPHTRTNERTARHSAFYVYAFLFSEILSNLSVGKTAGLGRRLEADLECVCKCDVVCPVAFGSACFFFAVGCAFIVMTRTTQFVLECSNCEVMFWHEFIWHYSLYIGILIYLLDLSHTTFDMIDT